MAQAQRWTLAGDYFENCNCDVVCPCEVSPLGLMRARPTQGHCDAFLAFHIESGNYGNVDLGGVNFVVAVHAPGVMAEGGWTVAAYLDERASPQQQEALGAILSGQAGGPFAALGPLISRNLGAKVVPIEFRKEGRRRSVVIPGILDCTVEAVPGVDPEAEVVKRNAHPFFPETVQAYGVRTTYSDHGMSWDSRGTNADYASFRWSGP
jgi:hypothetical protein